jgi:hypothetical protein
MKAEGTTRFGKSRSERGCVIRIAEESGVLTVAYSSPSQDLNLHGNLSVLMLFPS